MSWKWAAVAVAVAAVLLGAGWYGLKSIPYSVGYQVEAEFAAFPPDDRPLEDWLRTQPGVVYGNVGQRKGEPNILVVSVTMVRDGWGRTPYPDLSAKCDELGYRGRKAPFRGSTRRDEGVSPREPAGGAD